MFGSRRPSGHAGHPRCSWPNRQLAWRQSAPTVLLVAGLCRKQNACNLLCHCGFIKERHADRFNGMAANAGLEPLTFGRVLEVAQDRGTFPRGPLPDYDCVLTHKSQRSSYGPPKTPKWTDLEEQSKEEIQSPRSEQQPTAGFDCTWTRADRSTKRMNRSLRTRHRECTRKLFLRGR